MKTIFVHQGRRTAPDGSVDFVTITDQAWERADEAEDARRGDSYPELLRVAEFVELTPRVRLGLWLAEDSDRGWVPFQEDGERLRVELLTASEGACLDDESGGYDLLAVGHGPSLDAAIEDALSKLPKVVADG